MEIHIYAEWEDWIVASVMETLLLHNCASFHSLHLPAASPVGLFSDACETETLCILSSSHWTCRGRHTTQGPSAPPHGGQVSDTQHMLSERKFVYKVPCNQKASEHHQGVTSCFSGHLLQYWPPLNTAEMEDCTYFTWFAYSTLE